MVKVVDNFFSPSTSSSSRAQQQPQKIKKGMDLRQHRVILIYSSGLVVNEKFKHAKRVEKSHRMSNLVTQWKKEKGRTSKK